MHLFFNVLLRVEGSNLLLFTQIKIKTCRNQLLYSINFLSSEFQVIDSHSQLSSFGLEHINSQCITESYRFKSVTLRSDKNKNLQKPTTLLHKFSLLRVPSDRLTPCNSHYSVLSTSIHIVLQRVAGSNLLLCTQRKIKICRNQLLYCITFLSSEFWAIDSYLQLSSFCLEHINLQCITESCRFQSVTLYSEKLKRICRNQLLYVINFPSTEFWVIGSHPQLSSFCIEHLYLNVLLRVEGSNMLLCTQRNLK